MNDKLTRRQFIKTVGGVFGGASMLALAKLLGNPVGLGAAQGQEKQFLPLLPYKRTNTPTATQKPSPTPTKGTPPPPGLKNIILMHLSIGERLINQGDLRQLLTQKGYNFWDHNYNNIGLFMPDGTPAGYNYNVPNNNTHPDGYEFIFKQPLSLTPVHPNPPVNTFSGMMRHEIILFKSCATASAIGLDQMLVDYKTYYLNIRDTIDKYPNKLFIPFTPPPQPSCSTIPSTAKRARDFANWLKSPLYTAGHPNIFVFDYFDYLAEPDPVNTFKAVYDNSVPGGGCDIHPNRLANQTIAPILVTFIDNAAHSYP